VQHSVPCLPVTVLTLAEMSAKTNLDLRVLIRDLATHRDSVDRRQLYWALIMADLWVPARADSAPGHLQPGDLQPLDRAGPGGMASFAAFTHEDAARLWQDDEGADLPLRLEKIAVADLLPIVLDAGAGSLMLNVASNYGGELYRHELETCVDGIRKLAKRQAAAAASEATVSEPAAPETPTEDPDARTLWQRLTGWLG